MLNAIDAFLRAGSAWYNNAPGLGRIYTFDGIGNRPHNDLLPDTSWMATQMYFRSDTRQAGTALTGVPRAFAGGEWEHEFTPKFFTPRREP